VIEDRRCYADPLKVREASALSFDSSGDPSLHPDKKREDSVRDDITYCGTFAKTIASFVIEY
jgi:hypothetical protein